MVTDGRVATMAGAVMSATPLEMRSAGMHVLITEQCFGDSDGVAEALRGIGCRVTSCHTQTGLCRALAPGRRCPFDESGSPDLLVDVRGPGEAVTAREYGVVCAVRANCKVAVVPVRRDVPVVVPSGLETRATVATLEELLDACRSRLRIARRT
jgi:hypothetical protein